MTSFIDEDSLKRTLSVPAGRKVLWDLLALGGLYRQPFATDSLLTAFNCGSTNVGLMLFADCMSASPELTAMMIKEQGNADRERADSDPARNSGDGDSTRNGFGNRTDLGYSPVSSPVPTGDLGFDRFGSDSDAGSPGNRPRGRGRNA